MYATKKRKRIMKQLKSTLSGSQETTKSNPSKRHRERLNSELDHLASLLPYEQGIISKLDKLSVLRLAVNYLRTKSYFQVAIYDKTLKTLSNHGYQDHHHHQHHHHHNPLVPQAPFNRPIGAQEVPGKAKGGEVTTTTASDPTCIARAEDILQALNGFLLVVTCEGEVFFASETVEQYLGFHQSDIIHQSIMELIHSEDREQFKLQLFVRPSLSLTEVTSDLVNDTFFAFNQQFRRFTVRFRCLLDNTSGFITLEITGRLRVLHGQNLKSNSCKTLALFALCSPLGVLPSSEVQGHELTFKSKHKMDLSPISMDPRGKAIFGYTERELSEKKGYDLIHYDDSAYYAAAHQELIKTGSSGLIAYRLLSKDQRWIWLQTSSKVVYKNSKPDYINCVHRQLTSDEGNDLLGKRGSEFKLPYALVYDLGKRNGDACRPLSDIPSNQAKFCLRREFSDGAEPDSAKGEPNSTSSGSIVFEEAPGKRADKSTNQCSSTFNESKVTSEAHSLTVKGSVRPKPGRSQKKVREHLKEYLQAGRRRKTPYREISKSFNRQDDFSKFKAANKSGIDEGQPLRSAFEKANFRKGFDRGVYEHLGASNFYEASSCGLSERVQPMYDDSFIFNRSFPGNDELFYYGQSQYYNYCYYQRYQNNFATTKDLTEDRSNYCDYQNTLADCSRYSQIHSSLDGSLGVPEVSRAPTMVSMDGYMGSPNDPGSRGHSSYVHSSRFSHQSEANWKQGASEFIQEQTRTDEKNAEQNFHNSLNYLNKSCPRNSNVQVRQHDQHVKQLSARQNFFPTNSGSSSSIYSLEMPGLQRQVENSNNFLSLIPVHENLTQGRISPGNSEPERLAKDASSLPFNSFHWYQVPGDHFLGFDRSAFDSNSNQHDNDDDNNNHKTYNNEGDVESRDEYQPQINQDHRIQNYISLLNSPGLEQEGQTQCSEDYLFSLTSSSLEGKTLRVLGDPVQTAKDSEEKDSAETILNQKDCLVSGFSSIGRNYCTPDGPGLPGSKNLASSEGSLYETVRNQSQGGGLKACQITNNDSVLHNHRSVIRLNGRCTQQVQAVPVIRAPSIGTFDL